MKDNPHLNVLVLGAGSNVSQGILKALRLSELPCRVVGACVSAESFGLYTADAAYMSPLANDPEFIPWIIEICRKESIDAILSGSEAVMAVLARHRQELEARTGASCVVSPLPVWELTHDKLQTCRWLHQHDFAHPRFAANSDRESVKKLIAECDFPLIAKPRRGKGAIGVFMIENTNDLAYIARKPDYLIQELLPEAEGEFTVGCFCDRDGEVRSAVAMRRRLHCGTTVFAQAESFPEVTDYAIRIVQALRPLGPCNVQLRYARERPVCFEINARFSGTTPMRARLGVNEVEMALRHFVLHERLDGMRRLARDTFVMRYWNELYVDAEVYHKLAKQRCLAAADRSETFIEDYGLNT